MNFRDEIIEAMQAAIDNTQIWGRWNDWTSDRIPCKPIEICRYGKDGEDEIIVLSRHAGSSSDMDRILASEVSRHRATAAFDAALAKLETPSEEMVRAAMEGRDGMYPAPVVRSVLRAALQPLKAPQ